MCVMPSTPPPPPPPPPPPHTHTHTHTLTHSIVATRSGNMVMFDPEGGVDVGDVDSRAERVEVDIEGTLTEEQATRLVARAPQEVKP